MLEEIKPLYTAGKEFGYRKKTIIIGSPVVLDYQNFDARMKTNDFFIEWSSMGVKVYIETPMTEINFVVWDNYGLDESKLLALARILELSGF